MWNSLLLILPEFIFILIGFVLARVIRWPQGTW